LRKKYFALCRLAHATATRKRLADGTCKYVVENPLKSVVLALVTGLLIGRIIR
jgi:ElaB/YqjD/DUF883 family membrane-anchored ribosome-binding protein